MQPGVTPGSSAKSPHNENINFILDIKFKIKDLVNILLIIGF